MAESRAKTRFKENLFATVGTQGYSWDKMLDYGLHAITDQTVNILAKRGGVDRPHLLRNIPYINDGSPTHLLDIWVPPAKPGPSPVVFYIHGGGFVIGSKESHRIAGRRFAERGYLTVVINYRLSPRYPYPASIEDCCKALCWVWDHLEHYGGDRKRITIAGESAGGNLAAVLSMITAYKREEPWCREVWDRKIKPAATIPFCGWHEPLSIDHHDDYPASNFIAAGLEKLSKAIFGRKAFDDPERAPLLSAIRLSEKTPDRKMSPFLVTVGTWDPLYSDSVQLKRNLEAHDVPVQFCPHDKGLHAHHLIPFSPNNKQVWHDVEAFLQQTVQ